MKSLRSETEGENTTGVHKQNYDCVADLVLSVISVLVGKNISVAKVQSQARVAQAHVAVAVVVAVAVAVHVAVHVAVAFSIANGNVTRQEDPS